MKEIYGKVVSRDVVTTKVFYDYMNIMCAKLNIALLAGGNSSEREIALNSAQQVGAAMDPDKYNIFMIDINGIDWSYIDDAGKRQQVNKNDFSLELSESKVKFDYALILIHGTPGEDGKLQGYLDIMNVPYSSCGMVSSVVTFDKYLCKGAVEGAGVNLAKEILVRKGEAIDALQIVESLGLPLFVKPNASGSSFGVSKVKTIEELEPAIESAFLESDAVLIEEFIAGREVSCGVMIVDDKEYIFPITEIISNRDFFDYKAKYTDNATQEVTPADLEKGVQYEINKMTIAAYKACNCSGVVRIDFIFTDCGKPYMIEINSIPGMSSGSIIPKQLKTMGMSVGEMYDIIISDSTKVHRQ